LALVPFGPINISENIKAKSNLAGNLIRNPINQNEIKIGLKVQVKQFHQCLKNLLSLNTEKITTYDVGKTAQIRFHSKRPYINNKKDKKNMESTVAGSMEYNISIHLCQLPDFFFSLGPWLLNELDYLTIHTSLSPIRHGPVLVVEEAGVPGENHRPRASNW
jgi:hypothetical protein